MWIGIVMLGLWLWSVLHSSPLFHLEMVRERDLTIFRAGAPAPRNSPISSPPSMLSKLKLQQTAPSSQHPHPTPPPLVHQPQHPPPQRWYSSTPTQARATSPSKATPAIATISTHGTTATISLLPLPPSTRKRL